MSETSAMQVQVPQFDDAAYVQLVKETVCPKGTTDVEFRLFMAQARRSGLDPLIGQCFCVPRKQKVGNDWVVKNVFQPAESGMLARAEEFPDFQGVTGDAVYEKDTCVISTGDGQVQHEFSPCGDRGKLVGAWARVMRKDKVPVVRFLELGSRIQTFPDGKPMGLWSKNQADMIVKCARAAVLRISYPAPFGGLYIGSEVQEETHAPVEKQVAAPAPVQRITEKSVVEVMADGGAADAIKTIVVNTGVRPAPTPAPAVEKDYKDMTDDEKIEYWAGCFERTKSYGELKAYSASLISTEIAGGTIRQAARTKMAYGAALARHVREEVK